MTTRVGRRGFRHWPLETQSFVTGLAVGLVLIAGLWLRCFWPLWPHHLRAVSPSGKYIAEATVARGTHVLTMKSLATGETHALLSYKAINDRYVLRRIVWDDQERGIVYAYDHRDLGDPYTRHNVRAYELAWPPFAREVDEGAAAWAKPIAEELRLREWPGEFPATKGGLVPQSRTRLAGDALPERSRLREAGG